MRSPVLIFDGPARGAAASRSMRGPRGLPPSVACRAQTWSAVVSTRALRRSKSCNGRSSVGRSFAIAMRYSSSLLVALAAVQDASRAARELQESISASQAAYQKPDESGTGHGIISPVTAGDFTVQAIVLGRLAAAFPDDRFIAEESSKELLAAGDATRDAVMAAVREHGSQVFGSDISDEEVLAAIDLGTTGVADGWSRTRRTWVLDPIDGTKGFLRGEQFAVALALLDGGRPVLGVLGCPSLGECGSLFYASEGGGAFCGPTHGAASEAFGSANAEAVAAASTPVRVGPEPLGSGLVRTEAVERSHSNHAMAERVASRLGCGGTPSIRMDGQCKYGLISRGEAHIFTRLPRAGYVEWIWDHAAGSIIVQEAGGRVSDLEGRPLDFSRGAKLCESVRGIVASNGIVHEALLDALAKERAQEAKGAGSVPPAA